MKRVPLCLKRIKKIIKNMLHLQLINMQSMKMINLAMFGVGRWRKKGLGRRDFLTSNMEVTV